MRVDLYLVIASLSLGACRSSSDNDKDSKDVDAEVASAFRTSWANKDLTIASSADEDVAICIRFTSIPGACRYTTRNFNYGSDAAGAVVYEDTCDIEIMDDAVHIEVTCTNPESGGCRKAEYEGDTPAIDMTNSNKDLTGSETAIVGLGDQRWITGDGLCDAPFAAAGD